MADGATPQQNQQLAQLLQQQRYKNLIRPDKIHALPGLPDAEKQRLSQGARSLWNHIQMKPPEDQQHQEAFRKLAALTSHISAQVRKNAPQTAAQRPQSQNQGQQAQPQQQAPVEAPQQQNQQAAVNMQQPQQQQQAQIPEAYRTQAETINWLVPANQQNNPNYKEEVKRRYADAMYKRDQCQTVLTSIQAQRNQGKELSPATVAEQGRATQAYKTAQNFLEQLNNQQNQIRQQMQQAARNASGQNIGNAQQAQQAPGSAQQAMQNNNVRNAALDAARQQQMSRPGTGSPVTAQGPSAAATGLSTPTQQQSFQNMQRAQQPFAGSPQTATPNSAMAQQPQMAQSQQHAAQSAQQPQGQQQTPLTHQGAIDAAAKTYQNSSTPQSAGPNRMQGGQLKVPDMEKTNNTRWAISKEFKPATPTPVAMGAARPTMSGPNNGPSGQMGQPAIQLPPTYSLHGPGDRVLDKKKLDELVRQVCGPGDGTTQASLHPEVEEV